MREKEANEKYAGSIAKMKKSADKKAVLFLDSLGYPVADYTPESMRDILKSAVFAVSELACYEAETRENARGILEQFHSEDEKAASDADAKRKADEEAHIAKEKAEFSAT